MRIDFAALKKAVIPQFYGGEKDTQAQMYADAAMEIMRGRLQPGASIGTCSHSTSREILYILSGSGKAICGGKTERLAPGICHYCPRGGIHCLINDGDTDLVFFAVVPEQ